jgi:hypothetical protein
MKWILFVMLFVTPAQNLTKQEVNSHPLFESHRIWTLQSTSTMEFSSGDACVAMEQELRSSIIGVHVATMTMRTWCACDGKMCQSQPMAIEGVQPGEKKNFLIKRLYPPE